MEKVGLSSSLKEKNEQKLLEQQSPDKVRPFEISAFKKRRATDRGDLPPQLMSPGRDFSLDAEGRNRNHSMNKSALDNTTNTDNNHKKLLQKLHEEKALRKKREDERRAKTMENMLKKLKKSKKLTKSSNKSWLTTNLRGTKRHWKRLQNSKLTERRN